MSRGIQLRAAIPNEIRARFRIQDENPDLSPILLFADQPPSSNKRRSHRRPGTHQMSSISETLSYLRLSAFFLHLFFLPAYLFFFQSLDQGDEEGERVVTNQSGVRKTILNHPIKKFNCSTLTVFIKLLLINITFFYIAIMYSFIYFIHFFIYSCILSINSKRRAYLIFTMDSYNQQPKHHLNEIINNLMNE